MSIGNSELVNLSGRCERAIRKYFTSLNDNRFPEEKMFTFGGIITADCIRTKGGLYIALASTLARHYDDKDKMLKIDNFLDKYCDIEEKELEELSADYVEEILENFKNIVKIK